MDVSWGKFLQMLRYKAESAGCRVAEIEPGNTTRTCSGCGTLKDMPLWQRTYPCHDCGVALDRDHNAAMNILNKFTGREPALVGELLPTKETRQGSSMNQEARSIAVEPTDALHFRAD